MEMDWSESRRDRSEDRYQDDTPIKESEGALDDSEEHDKERSRDLSKHRSKDKKSKRDERDHRSRVRDRSKTNDDAKEREKEVKDSEKERTSSKEKRKEDREKHEKDRTKDKLREKVHDKDKHRVKDHDRDKDDKDHGKKQDRERERENETVSHRDREKERGKEKSKSKEKEKEKEKEREKDKEKERDRGKDREKEKDKERTRDRERERDHEKSRDRDILDREQAKESIREREEVDHDKERSRDREKTSRRSREDHDHIHNRGEGKHSKAKADGDDYKDRETSKQGKTGLDEDDEAEVLPVGPSQSQVGLRQRLLKMKEDRLAKKSEGVSEVLSWVNRSRKLEEKRNSEKEKALQRLRMFEEQDNVDEGDDEDDAMGKETSDALAGVKVLHGLDKVLEGGSVVLTLKDQDILASGGINEEMDMLENVEIGEQKRRQEAYKAAKKTTGVYDDKFSDELGAEKKMLPQYDDPVEEEGVTLGAGGRFTAEAERKLEELRRRLQGPAVKIQAEDLNSSVKMPSDYYTPEEMLRFKKPKKKKSLRKKEKLDLDALEAEAISAGLGTNDLGSRNDSRRQAAKEEQERSEAEKRSSAYQAAYAKAQEASRALRMEQAFPMAEEDDTQVLADDAEDLQKSLERARKLALKKQHEKVAAGPEAIALLASSATKSQVADAQNSTSGEADNKVVFTEMEEFVWGLQLDEEDQKPNHEDVFMDEDEAPKSSEDKKVETGGWTEVVDSGEGEQSRNEDKEEVVPDETIHEAPVGKGLSGALKLLQDRGSLKETIEWGGRNMDKKKSKLVGIHDEEGPKEIHLERTDEYGRILTPKEAFRLLSHKFHGKGPGKMKQEKRMKQYYDELKLKQMTSSDVLPQSVERMRDAQAQLKTPYLVLSGHVKPGQTSDPRSGFATVEKEVPGSLTPMLGDRKVEHFLGIKRKAEPGSSGTPKKPKT